MLNIEEIVNNSICEYIINTVFNDFPNHKGRPGKVGGSLPRNENQTSDTKEFKEISQKALEESRKQAENLTEEERASLEAYTNREICKQINGFLRGELTEVDDKIKEYIKNIENALYKSSLPQNTILYRGVDFNFIEAVFGKDIANLMRLPINEENIIQVKNSLFGRDFVEKGFMSTAYIKDKSLNTPILLEVNTPKGTKALTIDKISQQDQSELLINKGYKWGIKDVGIYTNKKWKILLDLF